MSKDRELPKEVVCLHCGKGFKLLHRSHLRVHSYTNQQEYRDTQGLDTQTPLHSESYAYLLRVRAAQPKISAASMGNIKLFQQRRRGIIRSLAGNGFFTPSTASILTGIPLTTLQSATSKGRLPYGLASLRVPRNDGFGSGGITKIINLVDLFRFVQGYNPTGKG